MTKDEAIQKLSGKYGLDRGYGLSVMGVIDVLAELGVLKPGEPKIDGAYEIAADALYARGVSCNSVALEFILATVGLKIVEKTK